VGAGGKGGEVTGVYDHTFEAAEAGSAGAYFISTIDPTSLF
jgi:hypothetical protein